MFYRSDVTTGPRPHTGLNGEWEMCPVPGVEPGDAPPADAKWAKINVPSLQPADKAHCAWYRKVFDAPEYVRGERIVLRGGQVLTEGWFYLNRQKVGHELHGSRGFEVDVTSAFKPGQRNELLVAVRDWLSYSPKNRERILAGEAPIFKDQMIDVASYTNAASMGLGGNVWLEARPAVSVDDVFIVTSVRNKKLTLKYRLLNTGSAEQKVTLTARVLDAGKVVKELPAARAQFAPGKTATVTLEAPWADAHYWWPEDPHLYVLQTDLQPASGAADRHIERFGFRELWVDGISFVLNGIRTKIRSAWAGGASGVWQATGKTDPAERLAGIWAWQERNIHLGTVQLTRTPENEPGVDEAAEVADETGLMMKLESDCNQVNFTFDTRFWNALVAHEIRVMDVYKNHASVVIWSAGNENMWGWIYQGEAAKTLGNRWQIKVVKAMREFDLMKRPVEWEADGDLMGGWEHHALHYPRELTGFSDVPNGCWWGPLDGKTVVPYSMGPITLGQKPLTVGEAFWPATLNRPLGATVMVGDEPYIGAAPYARAWVESSTHFINGFRDVEFALIDTYVSMRIQKPQTIILKQEDRVFHGGTTVRRDLNVHNDTRKAAKLTLRCALAGIPRVLWKTEMPLALAPAELKRVTVQVVLPALRVPEDTAFSAELWDGAKLVHRETRAWRIFPALAIKTPKGLKLSVFDPVGDTAAMLRKAKVTFAAVKDLTPPASGALILGREALKRAPEGPWREELAAFVRGGGKVVLLEQTETPDFTPVPLVQTHGRKTTMAYPRAADHPLMAGLRDEDMRWWAADHYVSADNYRKPERGNYLPLVDVGTGDGILETPLMEQYDGAGSFILCQMLLTTKVGVAPQADRMLQNLLDYLAAPACYRVTGRTAVLAAADAPLRKALDESRLIYDDLTGKADGLTVDKYKAAIVDVATGLTAAEVEPLRRFAEAGGHVMLHRATPEKQAVVEQLMGVRLRLFPVDKEPIDIQNHVARTENVELLAGISNHELFWASNAFFAMLRLEGNWWSGYNPKCPAEEMIADYYCAAGDDVPAERARKLTRPGTLLEAPAGKGYVLLSQLRIDQPVADCAVTVARLRSLLLTNLGCALRGEGGALLARKQRLSHYDYFTVDLSAYANRGLRDDKAAGLIGWSNQGENDMRELPIGRQTFAGIPFFIAAPKAAIALYSTMANNTDLPKEVKGIKIGKRADALFFLHCAPWCQEHPFKYRVNYDDGTSVEIPITAGQQVIDWWDDPNKYAEAMPRWGSFVAWTGNNPMRKGIILPGYEWTNPHPEKGIRDIDFLTVPENGYGCIPILAGLTGAVSRPSRGLVTDVIGTAGLKVRLGTQEEEIYYIGVDGIGRDNPYYAKAVEAHRNLVVGQTVQIVDDVVTRNAAGQHIAYVYLGDVYDVRSLVNAKIIGDGLGKLGNFEGNTARRMYLENLGFIAQQGKAGMWQGAPKP
jgi:hypothetical protein